MSEIYIYIYIYQVLVSPLASCFFVPTYVKEQTSVLEMQCNKSWLMFQYDYLDDPFSFSSPLLHLCIYTL